MGYYFYVKPLTSKDSQLWACMEYWTSFEAVMLSMGYNPKSNAADLSKDEAEEIADEYFARSEIVLRSLFSNEEMKAPLRSMPSRQNPDLKEDIYQPMEFVPWAEKRFPSFHEELKNAVNDTNPYGQNDKVGLKKLKKTPDASCSQVVSQPPNSISLLAKDLADKRWESNNRMTEKAEKFVDEQLRQGCNCNQVKLAEFMFENVSNDKGELIFSSPDLDLKETLNILKKAAKKIIAQKHPEQIIGIKKYRKPDVPCPVHDK